MSIILNPFQLLEINVISAQDLAPVSRSMRTYAVAWVHPDRKLSTRVDTHGNANPTWNDKFVFRVDDNFLRSDTSAIMIEIYALGWFRDVPVGTVRVLVGNLIPPPSRPNNRHHPQPHMEMRFVALQVRRPSGRPQGILNIGVALLNSSMRSMPLYTHLSASAVGFHDLIEGENEADPLHNHFNFHHHHQRGNDQKNNPDEDRQPHAKAQKLMRSRSERSERVTDLEFEQKPESIVNGSELTDSAPHKGQNGKKKKARSMVSGSEVKKGRKASSVISDSDIIRIIPNPNINGSDVGAPLTKKKNVKGGSIINGSDVMPTPRVRAIYAGDPERGPVQSTKPSGGGKGNGKVEFAPRPKGTTYPHGPYWADCEVGPSASEVAYVVDDDHGSTVDRWSLDESVEGLRSKLERWRTELPPLYDQGEYDSLPSLSIGGGSGRGSGSRQVKSAGPGLFSCFSNICGYECSCVCGTNAATVVQKNSGSGRQLVAPYP